MNKTGTPGSFTKNFGWFSDFSKLHAAIGSGFGLENVPVLREAWRIESGIQSRSTQLIPLNFFLYSTGSPEGDVVIVDPLVEAATSLPYDKQFAALAMATLHLSMLGSWKGTHWPDGDVANWANRFVREVVYRNGGWDYTAFSEKGIQEFLAEHIAGEPSSRRKMLTNYRYMLRAAGMLHGYDPSITAPNAEWRFAALETLWTRESVSTSLRSWDAKALKEIAYKHEVHKILGCTEELILGFVEVSLKQGVSLRLAARMAALDSLSLLSKVA